MTLDQISLVCVYSAMSVYALAFIGYAIDLAKRSSIAKTAALASDTTEPAGNRELVGVGGARAGSVSAGSTTIAGEQNLPSRWVSARSLGADVEYGRSAALRVAVALTVIGWLLHLVGGILRGIAASRVPWSNMYEFALTGTLIVITVFLAVLLFAKLDLRFLGTFVVGLATVMLAAATVRYYVQVVPLPPALQSYWLVIHVFVATTAVGFFAIGAALSAVQLLRTRRAAKTETGISRSFVITLPDTERLEQLAYRVNIVGFILWTFTLIAGAIWAEKAWGRYWGWDTKEVWTFIIWVVFAGYIHARSTRGWRGTRSAWLALIGFSTVLFNFTIVNVFFKGLHAYSGL